MTVQEWFKEVAGATYVTRGLDETRCLKCHKLLGYIDGRFEIKCPRCGEMNTKKESVENERGRKEVLQRIL
jgi:phage FluMu protein Com